MRSQISTASITKSLNWFRVFSLLYFSLYIYFLSFFSSSASVALFAVAHKPLWVQCLSRANKKMKRCRWLYLQTVRISLCFCRCFCCCCYGQQHIYIHCRMLELDIAKKSSSFAVLFIFCFQSTILVAVALHWLIICFIFLVQWLLSLECHFHCTYARPSIKLQRNCSQ